MTFDLYDLDVPLPPEDGGKIVKMADAIGLLDATGELKAIGKGPEGYLFQFKQGKKLLQYVCAWDGGPKLIYKNLTGKWEKVRA